MGRRRPQQSPEVMPPAALTSLRHCDERPSETVVIGTPILPKGYDKRTRRTSALNVCSETAVEDSPPLSSAVPRRGSPASLTRSTLGRGGAALPPPLASAPPPLGDGLSYESMRAWEFPSCTGKRRNSIRHPLPPRIHPTCSRADDFPRPTFPPCRRKPFATPSRRKRGRRGDVKT